MRGRPKTYRRSPKMREVEVEFDMPFHEVLVGFAQDGCNITFTCETLGFDRGWMYRKLQQMARTGYTIDWPCPYATRKKPEYPNTPAQQAARLANLCKRDPTKAAPWGNPRKTTRALIERAVALRAEQGLPWRQIAYQFGVDVSNLRKARKLYNIADPLGDKLVRQAQRQFTQFDI